MADWMDWPSRGTKNRLVVASVIIGIGVVVGVVVAPALTAIRPLPDPIIERVPIFTADVLDTGSACVYTWNGEVYTWSRSNLRIRLNERCPPRMAARTRYEDSLVVPRLIPEQP